MKIKWFIINRFLRLRMTLRWLSDKAAPHMPKIKRAFPKPPAKPCECGKPLAKIVFVDVGEGWAFEWTCDDDDCCYGHSIDGWFPFVFGWATRADLKRISIEEV